MPANPEVQTRVDSQHFVFDVADYESPSSKFQGYRELLEFGLRAPSPMLILGHEAFEEFQEHGLTPELREEIVWAFNKIRSANPSRGAYVGRAVYVPEVDNPKGPRSAGIYNVEEYVQQVISTWNYTIEHNYVKDGCDIALILHPFINVMEPRYHYGEIPIREGERLSWPGGNIVPSPEPGRDHQIRIVATFGTDEAVQSCPVDEYIVDLDRKIITKKVMTLKDTTFLPVSGAVYQPAEVPKRFQLEQALTDDEVLMVAAEAKKVYAQRPDARLEFIVQPDGVYIREIAPWDPPDEQDLLVLEAGEEIIGNVVRMDTLEDITKVTGSDALVYFGPQAFQERSSDLFQLVASLPGVNRVFGLLYGSIVTSHPARALRDSGRSVIHMGDRELQDGDRIRIRKGPDGKPLVESLDPYTHAVVPLSNFRGLYHNEAGPKAASLSRMLYEGIPIPNGFTLTTEAMWQFLKDIGLTHDIQNLDSVSLNDEALHSLTSSIQYSIRTAPISEALKTQIEKALQQYGYSSWAVRSSGNEDGDTSLAGLYESSVDVKSAEITDAIRKTLISYFSTSSIRKLRTLNYVPSKMPLGIIVHEYIPTEDAIGAVVFTFRDSILIEAAMGTPQGLVSHTEQNYVRIACPRNGADSLNIIPMGRPLINLTKEQVEKIILQVKQIETIFQRFQDVELIVSKERGIIILQARPLH